MIPEGQKEELFKPFFGWFNKELTQERESDMKDNNFSDAIQKQYGRMTEEEKIDLIRYIDLVCCARKFAGNVGDNPLCVLNRALEKAAKDLK